MSGTPASKSWADLADEDDDEQAVDEAASASASSPEPVVNAATKRAPEPAVPEPSQPRNGSDGSTWRKASQEEPAHDEGTPSTPVEAAKPAAEAGAEQQEAGAVAVSTADLQAVATRACLQTLQPLLSGVANLLADSLQNLPTQLAAALSQHSLQVASPAAEREQHGRVVAAVSEALQPLQQQVEALTKAVEAMTAAAGLPAAGADAPARKFSQGTAARGRPDSAGLLKNKPARNSNLGTGNAARGSAGAASPAAALSPAAATFTPGASPSNGVGSTTPGTGPKPAANLSFAERARLAAAEKRAAEAAGGGSNGGNTPSSAGRESSSHAAGQGFKARAGFAPYRPPRRGDEQA